MTSAESSFIKTWLRLTQDIFGKKNGSIPLIDSGEYLRG